VVAGLAISAVQQRFPDRRRLLLLVLTLLLAGLIDRA
jgi:CP family cyanate transporter-like MFS transporter